MSAEPILTVGIPTFNRRDAVVARVRELLEIRDEVGVDILVIDNASTDGTIDALRAEFEGSGVELQSNDRNLGYAGNLLRLIDVARTEFLTVISDEDEVSLSGLVELMALLVQHRPRLVSPRAQVREDECYRGRRSTREIRADEFQSASFYVSGITFQVESAQRDVAIVRPLMPENAAATYYPQVLLAALAILDGEALFLDALVTRQVVQLQTQISDAGPGAYWFVPARWAQFEGYEGFFDLLQEARPEKADEIEIMRGSTRAEILGLLESAAVAQFPGVASHVRTAPASFAARAARAARARGLGGVIDAARGR